MHFCCALVFIFAFVTNMSHQELHLHVTHENVFKPGNTANNIPKVRFQNWFAFLLAHFVTNMLCKSKVADS